MLLLFSCKTVKETAGVEVPVPVSRLHFLGSYIVPHNVIFRGTTVGGLSGIDYDTRRNVYYLICDDRSVYSKARFYTAKINMNARGIEGVQFVNVTTLRRHNGIAYPSAVLDPYHTPDPEALRYNPKKDQVIWSSEGERIVNARDTILENPSIISITRTGTFIDSFPLPEQMHMKASENGPRRNGVFEGMAFADGFRTLYVSMEEPIYDDGPQAGLADTSAWVRIIGYDVATNTPVKQYAYRIEPVMHPAVPENGTIMNGVSDILAVSKNQLLVTERSFSEGQQGNTVRLFLANLENAEDIALEPSLKKKPPVRAITKRLLLNMNSLGIYIDNIEGATFGPDLPNGHKTLILVADNNFSGRQKNQFLLFEVLP